MTPPPQLTTTSVQSHTSSGSEENKLGIKIGLVVKQNGNGYFYVFYFWLYESFDIFVHHFKMMLKPALFYLYNINPCLEMARRQHYLMYFLLQNGRGKMLAISNSSGWQSLDLQVVHLCLKWTWTPTELIAFSLSSQNWHSCYLFEGLDIPHYCNRQTQRIRGTNTVECTLNNRFRMVQ